RLLQAGQPEGVEGVQRVEHRLVVDTQVRRDAGDTLAAGAGQQDLAAAQDEGVLGAHALLQLLPLVVAQRSHKDGRSHALERTTFSFIHLAKALGTGRATQLDLVMMERKCSQCPTELSRTAGSTGGAAIWWPTSLPIAQNASSEFVRIPLWRECPNELSWDSGSW